MGYSLETIRDSQLHKNAHSLHTRTVATKNSARIERSRFHKPEKVASCCPRPYVVCQARSGTEAKVR